MTGYTTREVAEVLDVSPRRVRAYAREGLVEPSRGARNAYRFSFRDIILLRTARELRAAGRVSERRLRDALRRLRDQLPRGRPLSAVHISAVGDQVVVRDRGTVWEPATGQLAFDLAVEELAARVQPFARRAAGERTAASELDADALYDLALDLEAVSPAEAESAYHRVLALRSDHFEALLNLGRLHHEKGRLEDAERHYRRAAASDPGSALASFNLGVALEDAGREREALAAYVRSVDLDPALAEAHFNLARLYERRDRPEAAVRHLAAYRRLRGVAAAAQAAPAGVGPPGGGGRR